MKITGFSVEPLNLDLPVALTVAYGSYPVLEYALIQLHTDEGFVGLGEASPDPEVTGETQAVVLTALNKILPQLVGCDPFNIAVLIGNCFAEIGHAPAAIAAIDMALYDLMGKKLGVPVYQLLGGKSRSYMTLYPVIPMDDPKVMAGMAAQYAGMGATRFKIKLGSDPAEDYERLKRIQAAAGADAQLRLDVNQGWGDADTAIKAIESMAGFNIEYVEQPVKDADLAGMAAVTKAVKIPIMADESSHGPEDVYKIAAMKAADLINIKLMKCGGIYQAMKMLAVAEASGLPCILGSMGETCIGSAAGLHFCLAQASVTACELIGPLFISNDPSIGFEIDRTTLQTKSNDKPGLGVELK
jgi:L-alanine-DL-glutamate epimerase-like enolase superfamily enzyme